MAKGLTEERAKQVTEAAITHAVPIAAKASQEVSAQQFSGLTLLPHLPTPDLTGLFGFPKPDSAETA